MRLLSLSLSGSQTKRARTSAPQDDCRPRLRQLLPEDEVERIAGSPDPPYEVLVRLTRFVSELPSQLPESIRVPPPTPSPPLPTIVSG